MNVTKHNELTGKIWEIANLLRGPYRPPQYRLVMLPMVVLRRLDCVLEPTKDRVLAEHERPARAQRTSVYRGGRCPHPQCQAPARSSADQ